MSEFRALPPGIVTQLQKGTADDSAQLEIDDFWKQFDTKEDNRSDNVQFLEDSDTDGVSLRLKKPNSSNSDWLSEIPAKSISVEINDTRIDCPLPDQKSNTSKLLATLLEAETQGWAAYQPVLKDVRRKVASFALGHSDCVLRTKAIMVYATFGRTRYFNSRKQVQTAIGFYDADFQLLCIELGRLLEDSVFAYLAKREMLFAWIDLIDLPNKPSGIHGEQLQKLFTMMPFSDDFLAEFRYKHKQQTDLPRRSKGSMGWYITSSKEIHIESWKQVAVHTQDHALAEKKMPRATFRPILGIALPRPVAKRPPLPNTPVFHRRLGDKYAHLFVQRDAYKDFKDKKEFNFKPREPLREWW